MEVRSQLGLPPGPPAPLEGFAAPAGASRLETVRSSAKQKLLFSYEALRRSIHQGLGPSLPRWSTYPGDNLTPEGISRCRKEAHAGYPWRWAELCEQVGETNSTIYYLGQYRKAWVHSVPYRVDPPEHFKGDVLAQNLAAWGQSWINGLRPVWSEMCNHLLDANGAGWAGSELHFTRKTCEYTEIPTGDQKTEAKAKATRVENSFVPGWATDVHPKSFVFDQVTDEPLLYVGDGLTGARFPAGKIMFHRCLGTGVTGRRGYMGPAVWLEYALQSGWRDLILFMHLYGLPQFALMIDKDILEQPEERAVIDEGLARYGQGDIPVWLEEVKVAPLGQVQGPPLHPAVIQLVKDELSQLIVGSTLVMGQGSGQGSYNMSSTHEATSHKFSVPDRESLARSFERYMITPVYWHNLDLLCQTFKADPEQVLARIPIFGWKMLSPSPTVPELLSTYKDLAALNFPLSRTEVSQRTGAQIGMGDDRLEPPEPKPLPGQAAAGKLLAKPDAGKAPPSQKKKDSAQEYTRPLDLGAPAEPGVMVALYPSPELARVLAVDGGEPAEGLHLTLCYLGRLRQQDLAAPAWFPALVAALGTLAAPTLRGTVGGVVRFPPSESSEGQSPFCAAVDVAGLAELRQAVVQAAEAAGAPVATAHGFTPHITLQYLAPDAPSPVDWLAPQPVRFDEVHLVVGNVKFATFPLRGKGQEP